MLLAWGDVGHAKMEEGWEIQVSAVSALKSQSDGVV